MAIKHAFTSTVADGTDTSVVRPSNWNADHTLEDATITETKLASSVYGTTTELANVTKAAEDAGVSTKVARADHKHDITTATPSTVGAANAEGSASSLARSDHVHQGTPAASTYVPTWGGFSVAPSGGTAVFIQLGKLVWVAVRGFAAGTSNATTTTITLPVASLRADVMAGMGKAFDNGAHQTLPMRIDTRAGSTTADLYLTLAAGTWTASGGKVADFTLLYEAV